jgi:hypothetical protein
VNRLVVSTFVSLMWTSGIWAQCATGVDTGGGNCVPPDAPGMPGYSSAGNGAQPPRPTPVWADQWGAIVVDRGTGEAGTVVNRDSKTEAINAAMHDCQIEGSPHCEVLLTYFNQCAALAQGGGSSGIASNPTLDGAKAAALGFCGKDSTTCEVVYSACSVARRVR